MRASSVALAVMLAAAPAAVGAVPKAPTEAELLFVRGVEAFEAGRYASAAAYLSQAYALEPEGRLAYNTALAYERAEMGREAVIWYRLAAGSAEASLRAEAEAALVRLAVYAEPAAAAPTKDSEAPARQAALELRLGAFTEGARVRVDGGHALALPGSISVVPGVHLLEAEAPGCVPWRESVTVAAGESRVVSIVLAPVAAEAGLPGWWIGSGVTAAAAAVGVGYYFVSAGHFDEADRLAQAGVDRVGFDREQADGRSAATLSIAAYGVAALGAVATGLLWWWERDAGGESGSVAVVPLLAPTAAGLSATWRP